MYFHDKLSEMNSEQYLKHSEVEQKRNRIKNTYGSSFYFQVNENKFNETK